MLTDTAYGGDDNYERAAEHEVRLIAPDPGNEPKGSIGLADFSISDKGEVITCPLGLLALQQRINKKSRCVVLNVPSAPPAQTQSMSHRKRDSWMPSALRPKTTQNRLVQSA